MGKIFSVEIEYAVYKHTALVSVWDVNEESLFHIQFLDTFLQELFQTEHIRYKGIKGYQSCDVYEDDLGGIIIERIANAIEQKLYGGTALIRKLFSHSNLSKSDR
jgi:hypothetical protein